MICLFWNIVYQHSALSVCPRIGDLPPIYGKVCGETWSTYIRNQGLFGPFGYPMFVYKPSNRRSNLAANVPFCLGFITRFVYMVL